jgi:hypothetical protein
MVWKGTRHHSGKRTDKLNFSAVGGNNAVGGLNVTVKVATLVNLFNTVEHINSGHQDRFQGERLAVCGVQEVRQGQTAKFHDH